MERNNPLDNITFGKKKKKKKEVDTINRAAQKQLDMLEIGAKPKKKKEKNDY